MKRQDRMKYSRKEKNKKPFKDLFIILVKFFSWLSVTISTIATIIVNIKEIISFIKHLF
ncbi:hypothetical protein [Staphylococcus hominis]|uniref:hypothetical protein n=1 Tax=Staphylococcus hominis TaxID=1290 RepID=UPI001642AF71|nr:hypothetical protein [Staphylococcus hominis]